MLNIKKVDNSFETQSTHSAATACTCESERPKARHTYKVIEPKGIARALTLRTKQMKEDEQAEKEREEEEVRILKHDITSSRAASIASAKAKRERGLSATCIRETKEVLEILPRAIEKFDNHMHQVIRQEEDRIDREERMKEKRLGFALNASSSKISFKALGRSDSRSSNLSKQRTASNSPMRKTGMSFAGNSPTRGIIVEKL